MPKDLAALLVDDGIVAAGDMERALERQGEAGGALDTALLELELVQEPTLVAYLARAADLPAAPDATWASVDPRARRVFPSKVAERHGLAPFALDGRELSLVATVPVDLALLDEISFMLSLHLTPHVGPEYRVRELIHRLYGSSLPSRLAALAGPVPAPDAGGAPPRDTAAEAAAAPEPSLAFELDVVETEPLAAALAAAVQSAELDFAVDEEPPDEGTEPARDGVGADAAAAAAPAAAEAAPAAPSAGPERARPDRSAPPRWTLDDARAALAAAANRDEVVLAALRYARDFFSHAAMFAVAKDVVVGHDALGATEDARERARGTAIYATDPGIFRTVLDTRSPYLGPVDPDPPGNGAVLGGLGRGAPRTVLVFPVLLRDRPVCILYADNGDAPVSPRRLGDLLVFAATLGAAFERVIRDRKERLGPRRPRHTPRPPASPAEPLPAHAPPESGDAAAGGPQEPDAAADLVRALVGTAARSPERERIVAALAARPDEAAAALCAALPGPLEIPPEALDSAPVESWGPVPAAIAAVGPAAVGPLGAAVSDREPARRRAAAALLGRAGASALGPVAERVFDADAAVARTAVAALAAHRRDPEIRPVAEKLRRALLSGIGGRPAAAARALRELRDVEAIPLLIQVLETPDPGDAEAAAGALSAITLQRLGTSARRWLAWWRKNRGRGRAEWLFSGLTSADRDVRSAAADELRAAAPSPVEYSVDLPPDARERAARAWAGWWARSGRVL